MSFMNMKKATLAGLAALVALPSALAHGHVAKWSIGGTEYAGFNPSNPSEYGATPERPTINSDQGYADFTSAVIATGGTDTGTNTLVANGKGGDTVVATWNTWPESHKGSISQYMAKCPNDACAGVAGADLDWFKISETTYDPATDTWPTEKIASGLTWTFTLPSDIPGGQQYLLRHELLAMHTVGAPQFYPVVVQLQLESSGTVTPTPTGKFPDMYLTNNMATTQDIYQGSANNAAFVPPGIAVYSGSTTPAAADTAATAADPPAATTAADTTPTTATTPTTPAAATTTPPAATTNPPATSGGNLQTYAGAALGIAAPAVTASGDKYLCNGDQFNFKGDALTRSCDIQRNLCMNAANALPNAQVAAATNQCQTQANECTASVSSARRRDNVIARFAKRVL